MLAVVRRHLRKQPGQAAVMGALVALVSSLLCLGVFLTTVYPAFLVDKAEALRTPDLVLLVDDDAGARAVVDDWRTDPRVAEQHDWSVLHQFANIDFNGQPVSSHLTWFDLDSEFARVQAPVVERLDRPVDNPVYLPLIFRTGGGFELGDPVTVDVPGHSRTYHVAGFTEPLLLGGISMGNLGLGVPHADYTRLSAALPTAHYLEVTAADADTVPALRAEALATVNAHSRTADVYGNSAWSAGYQEFRSVNLIASGMFSVSVVTFAVVIGVVVGFAIRFLISNAIAQDMLATGSLKAAGFTSRQIVASYVLTYTLIGLVGGLVGIGLGYLTLPWLAQALTAQTGLRWNPGFDAAATALPVLVVLAVVVLSAWLSAGRIRRIWPVEALRTGTATHSFRHNVLPLHRRTGPLDLALGLKRTLQRPGHSLMLTTVIAMVAFVATFSVALQSGLLSDRVTFVRTIFGDIADVSVSVQPGQDADAVAAEIATMAPVTSAEPETFVDATLGQPGKDGTPLYVYARNTYDEQRYDPVYQGRNPRHANEIVVAGSMAERDGIAIGDTVQVDALGGTADYLVVGLMQTGRNLGSWAQVTTDGFHRLAPGQQLPSIAVEVPESADAGVVAKAISERFGAQLRMSSDTRSAVAAQMDVYLRLGNLLGWAILGLGAVVIALVVGMVATTTIVRDRRDYGVQRALGFTSGQLIRQNVYWFTPIVTLGAAAGAWVGQVTAGPLLSLMLQGIGVSKLSLSLPSGLVPLLVAGILGYALAVTALAALRIRRYTAQRLLTS